MRKPSNGMHPAEREIQEYLDGEMAPSRIAEIETHLHEYIQL